MELKELNTELRDDATDEASELICDVGKLGVGSELGMDSVGREIVGTDTEGILYKRLVSDGG